ncbi:hypothetical protein B9Z19DRAFT_1090736 [Tuber borchii]|uniref:Uncharacterized protein n=1 Tax=Tuber borchii TaxID=42251 RepID=A0A2T6ZIF4_TUBBO|nr:hypothetical protein B9Z19DRAFT_1090736 [Tuber borchii]
MITGGNCLLVNQRHAATRPPLLLLLLESAPSYLAECLLFYCALAEHIALLEEVLPCGDVSLYFSLSLSCDLGQQLRTTAPSL